jgi:hypothetical protein
MELSFFYSYILVILFLYTGNITIACCLKIEVDSWLFQSGTKIPIQSETGTNREWLELIWRSRARDPWRSGCNNSLWKTKNSNCVKFWTTVTHFEIFFQIALNLGLTLRTLKKNIFFPRELRRPILTHFEQKPIELWQKECIMLLHQCITEHSNQLSVTLTANQLMVTNPDRMDADCIALFIFS